MSDNLKEANEIIGNLRKEVKFAKEALKAMYALSGGMEKPGEHKATRAAFILTEQVLYGQASDYLMFDCAHIEGE